MSETARGERGRNGDREDCIWYCTVFHRKVYIPFKWSAAVVSFGCRHRSLFALVLYRCTTTSLAGIQVPRKDKAMHSDWLETGVRVR